MGFKKWLKIFLNISIMKTLLITLALGFNMFGGTTADVENSKGIQTQITESISFPNFAKEMNAADKVNVDFRINEDYKINIINIDTDNAMMVQHIENQLEGLTIEAADSEIGKRFQIAISFIVE